MSSIPDMNESIQHIRTCSPGEISQLVSNEIPQDRLPTHYLESLSEEDMTVCFRASMICWTITGQAMVPREMQLRTHSERRVFWIFDLSLSSANDPGRANIVIEVGAGAFSLCWLEENLTRKEGFGGIRKIRKDCR